MAMSDCKNHLTVADVTDMQHFKQTDTNCLLKKTSVITCLSQCICGSVLECFFLPELMTHEIFFELQQQNTIMRNNFL